MINLSRMTPALGAEVHGVDLRRITDDEMDLLGQAFVEHKLLVFRDQELSSPELEAFAQRWGPLDTQELDELDHPTGSSRLARAEPGSEVQILEHDREHPAAGYLWHSDITWCERPNKATILMARVVPRLGGDTLFCDMGGVLDSLSAVLHRAVTGLTARHDRLEELIRRRIPPDELAAFLDRHPPVDHPVVCTHPETGQPYLYVNPSFTRRINELPEDESRAVLDLLFSKTHQPEHQCRVSWAVGTVAVWDNRILQHNIVSDYYPERRRMERLAVAGERPR